MKASTLKLAAMGAMLAALVALLVVGFHFYSSPGNPNGAMLPPCKPPLMECNGICVAQFLSTEHCGKCGKKCYGPTGPWGDNTPLFPVCELVGDPPVPICTCQLNTVWAKIEKDKEEDAYLYCCYGKAGSKGKVECGVAGKCVDDVCPQPPGT